MSFSQRFVTWVSFFVFIFYCAFNHPTELILLLNIVGHDEYIRLTGLSTSGSPTMRRTIGAVHAGAVSYLGYVGGLRMMTLALFGCEFSLMLLNLWQAENGILPLNQEFLGAAMADMFGLVWTVYFFSHSVLIFNGFEEGRTLVLYGIVVIGLCDTFAYIVGKLVGRTYIFPRISGNKTLEGGIGYFVGGVGGSLATVYYFDLPMASSESILLGLLMGFFAMSGDLFESVAKRCFSVKDTGSILPGWGGLLDRLDSYLLSFPALYYYLCYCSDAFTPLTPASASH